MRHHEAFGATGKHPLGHVSPDDEGELRFGIIASSGRVLIDFGKPVHSLGFDAEQAESLARVLLTRAKEAREQASALSSIVPQG